MKRARDGKEAEIKLFAPVYIECKIYVACVRLGHDTSDFVELLALATSKSHHGVFEIRWKRKKQENQRGREGGEGVAHSLINARDIEHVLIPAGCGE